MSDILLGIFDDEFEFPDTSSFLPGVSSDELFTILERLEGTPELTFSPKCDEKVARGRLVSQRSTSSSTQQESENEVEPSPSPSGSKRRKLSDLKPPPEEVVQDGQQRMLHITVERNRRKQMNEHLAVLRTLMPSFYVKRGDQASIIGGVVDYIKELQQVLHSLEAKKQRKVYSEVLSPRVVSSPRQMAIASTLSPRKPPLSPRVSLPASPRTPTPSPYKPKVLQHGYLSPTSYEASSTSSSSFDAIKDLAATSRSSIAEIEVKFSGANVLVKAVSRRISGQALKIITALEGHALEIIDMSICSNEDTMVNSFTIKIGIDCKLSADELADEIQQTFC